MKYILQCLWLSFILLSCGGNDSGSNSLDIFQEVDQEILIDRNEVIWGFDFLPNNKIIFTQRNGGLFIFDLLNRDKTEIRNLPQIATGGEGGLLDLELHPEFTSNNLVYFCFTDSRNDGRGMSLGKAVLSGEVLSNVETIFRTNRSNTSSIHFGCRIEFENNEKLYLSTGDHNNPSEAQDPASHFGKILKMNVDGSNLEIWSLGHRNVQGLAIRPDTGELFASEHGPTGGDELNLIQKGSNYGWPLVTRGQPPGSLGESAPGFANPLISWTPAIAPSGIAFWRGNLYIATLRGRHIRRITLDGNEIVAQDILLNSLNARFRNLSEGPDGFLYFSTDDGKIGRLK